MGSIHVTNIFAAGCMALASLFLMLRVLLLDPDSPNFPKAPAWLRNCMLLFAAVCLYTGINMVLTPMPTRTSSALFAFCLMLYKLFMLANVVRQRYPEHVWQRLERINDRLHCDQNPFVKWLAK